MTHDRRIWDSKTDSEKSNFKESTKTMNRMDADRSILKKSVWHLSHVKVQSDDQEK